ncbi:MAG: IS21 family transposase [Oscillospiraceae bacterium]|nr:IS21 family transposase [Oscillospiraceae bacterium]
MLTMEQVYRIRTLRKYEGKSLRKISEITGHDFETVKKYVEKEDFNTEIRPKQKRQSKLSPYKEIITTWLVNDKHSPRKQRHTAKRVYDRLKEIYGDDFNVCDRSVRKLVASIRRDIEDNPDCYLPLEHPPGEAQSDFGEAQFIESGVTYDGYYLNMSYPHSNSGYTQLFKSPNQECLLEGMKAIFEHTGGVPVAIWFDNMSPIVTKIRSHGERDLTEGFLRFMMHYGFESNFCNPDAGHEKGSVENKVGYHRRNLFVPIPEFNDLKEYNKDLLLRCDRDMDRDHYKGRGKISKLFLEDKSEFSSLPKRPFEVFTAKVVKADKYGKVRYDKRTYSTSPLMAGREVVVKAGAYDIETFDTDGKHIINHGRLYGKNMESMNWIPYLELLSKRPTALKYTGLYNDLPTTLREYLDNSDYDTKKYLLKLFAKMTLLSGMDAAVAAFNEGLNLGVSDPDSIWALYCRLTTMHLSVPELNLPDTIPELKVYVADISVYDELIRQGGKMS